ncbi:rhodanese-like domain-containing protein [Thalassotalea sp. M1531]|uniref:Rhodanese-like domain-containing protein n=1 Tax=Thalassotalea algicola TaxID=2716224 RepID=A0A7Y0Q5I3_9GAMM|nr:rhodanese-like domain-containing protein [Thalassotalea algicola]NMP30348.1 rhodanese-like domain-containing protein [Thalassotalea algicola]
MTSLFKTIFIVILTILSLSAYADRPTVSQEQVLSLINAPKAETYTLLDVRSDKEFSEGHVKSAINVSHDALTDKLSMLPNDKDQLVIVYCRSGRRAGIAEQILRDKGFTNVWHLDGDMKGWQASELPLVK